MNDDGAEGTLAAGFLKLIAPAAVIGHRLAVKLARFWQGEAGIVNQDQGNLALHVQSLVVVPIVFGCLDAIADKDQGRIFDLDALIVVATAQHDILTVVHRQVTQGDVLRLAGGVAHHRYGLQEAAIVGAYQPGGGKGLAKVIQGQLLTLSRRGTALKFIRGEGLNIQPESGFVKCRNLLLATELGSMLATGAEEHQSTGG